MTTTPEGDAFYAARDIRTAQYGGDAGALGKPVTLLVTATAAQSRSGQVAAVALVEMLTRVHRMLRIVTPDAPLLCQAGTSGTFREVLHDTAAGIDPHQDTRRNGEPGELVVQVGADAANPVPAVLACWNGGRGEVHLSGKAPAAPPALYVERDDALNVPGAATAAVLAAAATFRLVHGDQPRPAALNLLERTADEYAGTNSLAGPVDVGDHILVIGAGAVTHGLAHWVREFAHTGEWSIVDGDDSELHNTNRCLGMTAADAGWPSGVRTAAARPKVEIAAGIIGARPIRQWFDQKDFGQDARPDLILPLANERGVRVEVGQLGEALLLHATTSPNWTAELHRHVTGPDDCPGCRLPDNHQPQLLCATGSSRPHQESSGDAALPFLSAGAGLLLAVAVLDLGADAGLLQGRANHWRLHLELGARLWQAVRHPGGRCPHTLSEGVRNALHDRSPRRWDNVAQGTPRANE